MVFMMMLMPSFGWTHPPADIHLSYDQEGGVLTAEILHPVSNPEKHFIRLIKVLVNGTEAAEQQWFVQENPRKQTLKLALPLKTGDKVVIEAYCNITGKKTREMVLE